MPRKKSLSFEEALSGLEDIVRAMEAGDMPLAELTENYSKGIELSQQCLQALRHAEKVMDIEVRETADGVAEQELTLGLEADGHVEG